MDFKDRLRQTQTVVEVLHDELWQNELVARQLVHVEYGAEHVVPPEVHDLIRYVHTHTARHIKFAPDFFVVDRKNPHALYLLEYKCTQTPLYSRQRIQMLRRKSPRNGLDWQDIGQIEAEAYDNYQALAELGIRVAVLDYCAYHDRLLLCEFVGQFRPLHRDSVRLPTNRGSRTPFINLDLRTLRSLHEFLVDEHALDVRRTPKLVANAAERLRGALPVRHHRNSPLYGAR